MTAVAKEKSEVVIRTKRLTLAPLRREHAAPLFELLNDWEVVKMLAEVPWPLRLEDTAEFIASMPMHATDDFAILTAEGPIGVAAVKKPGSGDPPRKMPRLGYWIGRKHWRQGYGTEAIGALVDHAFRTYPAERVGAGVFHDNASSRALLEKLGFRGVGPGSCISRSRGGTVVTVDMQITRNEWAARSPPDLAWPEPTGARLRDPAARIETKRLVLRPVTPADAEAIFAIFANWEVVRTLSAPPWPYALEHARQFIDAVSSGPVREAAFAILLGNALIGGISARLRPASNLQRDIGPNIGYWIGEPYWGKGYMTEAARDFIRFVFDTCDCDAVYSGVFAESTASLRVQAKLGFVTDGETMLISRPRGGEFRHINTVLTRAAWEEARQ
jgi:RimJ/RimL family protein N-acetyltransferase